MGLSHCTYNFTLWKLWYIPLRKHFLCRLDWFSFDSCSEECKSSKWPKNWFDWNFFPNKLIYNPHQVSVSKKIVYSPWSFMGGQKRLSKIVWKELYLILATYLIYFKKCLNLNENKHWMNYWNIVENLNLNKRTKISLRGHSTTTWT